MGWWKRIHKGNTMTIFALKLDVLFFWIVKLKGEG